MTLRSCDSCRQLYEAVRPRSKYCGPTCRVRASRLRRHNDQAGGQLALLVGKTAPELRQALRRAIAEDAGATVTLQLLDEIDRHRQDLDRMATLARRWLDIQISRGVTATGSPTAATIDALDDTLRGCDGG